MMILRRIVLAGFLALAMLTAFAAPATAASTLTAIAAEPAITFSLPALPDFIGLVVTVLLPLIVGIVTRSTFQHKGLVLLALAAITGLAVELLETITAGSDYDIGRGIFNAGLSFGIAVLVHYGFFKPEGITARVQDLGPQ